MQAKSFIEVLANELRKEIRAEIEAELAAFQIAPAQKIESSYKADQVQLWLNLKMGGAFISPHKNSAAKYSSIKSKNQKTPEIEQPLVQPPQSEPSVRCESRSERKGAAVTTEQTLALELFRREGASLETTFSESQLKASFRKIALHIHPDRHLNANETDLQSYAQRFQALVESAEILESTLI